MSGLRFRSDGTCDVCGKQRYRSRAMAKKTAKQLFPGQHMNPYRCGEDWHIGHLFPAAIRGQVDRNAEAQRRAC